MDLHVIHSEIRKRINKEITGHVSPATIDRALDQSSLMLFQMLTGSYRDYAAGRPQRVYYLATSKVGASLSPFKEKESFSNTNNIDTPNDLLILTAITVRTNERSSVPPAPTTIPLGKNVKIFDEHEIGGRVNSQLLEPSYDEPVAYSGSIEDGITIYPTGDYSGIVWYLRRPATPEYSYTLDGREVVYDQSGSTQLEWLDMDVPRLIDKTVSILTGGELKDFDTLQVSMNSDKTPE